MEIPIVGESYTLVSQNASAQETINLFPEIVKSGKVPVALYGTPGLDLKVTAGNGPIRAMRVMGAFLYVLSGNTLYKIDSSWAATSLGTVSSSSDGSAVAASMSDNGTQLVILTPTDGKGYIYTIAGGLVLISDADWVASDTVTFMDTYFIFSRTGTNRFHLSATNDGTSYAALEFASAESHSDAIVAVLSIQDRLWLFGKESIEQWQDTANATFTFEKIIGATIERGCAAAASIAELDNTVFWLGDDHLVYRAGLTPERISTHAVEQAISRYTTISDARGYAYAQDGHTFYVLTFPTQDVTWCYDVATQAWHKRKSAGVGRHRVSTCVAFNNKTVLGDYANGKIYVYDMDKYTDDGATITRTRITQPVYSGNERLFMSRMQVDFQSGVGLCEAKSSRYWRIYITESSAPDNLIRGYEAELRGSVGGTDQCTGGTASASHNNSTVYKLFNDNGASDYWISNTNPSMPCWFQYDFGSGNAVSVAEFGFMPGNSGDNATQSPKAFSLQWSDDGSNFTTLSSWSDVTDWIAGVQKLFPITNAAVAQGSDPQCMLSWSDDGGHTYGNEHWRGIGKIGEYASRAIWRRLGRFYQRIFKLVITDPVKVVILGAQADVEKAE